MTVKELIEILEKVNPNKKVINWDEMQYRGTELSFVLECGDSVRLI